MGIISEKRLLGEEGWREYSQKVLDLKRKASILDYNIKRCGDLLMRLDRSPFKEKIDLEVRNEKESKREEYPMGYPIPMQMPMPGIYPPYPYPEHSQIMRPSQIPQTNESVSPQQNPKIKKFRVLKIETRMQNVETRLEGLENEIKNKLRSEIDGIKNTVKNEIMAEIYREKIEEIDDEIKEIDSHVEEAKDEPKYAEYLKKRKKVLEEKKKHIKEKVRGEQIIVEGNEKLSGHICVACGAEVGDADKCPSCGLSINVTTNGIHSQDKRAGSAKVGT
ncbi:MAG: hypothetical protein QXT63_08180, partial [Thermoplasmata archaeon]